MCSLSLSDIKIRKIYEIVNRISSFPHSKMYVKNIPNMLFMPINR